MRCNQQISPPCEKTMEDLLCEMFAEQLKGIQNIETKKIIRLEIQGYIVQNMVLDTTLAFHTHQIIVPNYLESPDCSHPQIT